MFAASNDSNSHVKRNLKRVVRTSLESNDLDVIVALAKENKRVLSLLVRSSYEKDTLISWRAIKAVGLVARALVKTDHDFLRETCRKLLWSLSDESGAIGWSAPELLGEIVSTDPEKFSDIIPLIAQVYDLEEDVFRPGVVYALGRIAETASGKITGFQKVIMMSLVDKDPLTNIYALELVGNVWEIVSRENSWSDEYKRHIAMAVKSLITNKKVVRLYQNNNFINYEVGEYAEKIAKKLKL